MWLGAVALSWHAQDAGFNPSTANLGATMAEQEVRAKNEAVGDEAPVLAVWSRVTLFTSLCLGFHTYKMGKITASNS